MPTVTATQVKCPECNARLDVSGDAATATCSYCGTVARIQRRTQVLQMRVPMPPPQRHEPARIARQVRSPGNKLALALTLVLGIGPGLAIAVFFIGRSFGVFHSTHWNSHMLVTDIDGDGVDDFVGFDRDLARDRMQLMAVSGKDGHVLWRSSPLGNYTNVYQDWITRVGDAVLVVDKLAHIAGYDAKTGAKRWQVEAAEVIDTTCAGDTGHALLHAKNGAIYAVSLADGRLAPASGECRPKGGAGSKMRGAQVAGGPALVIDGMAADEAYSRGTGPRIALGHRAAGTTVPMIAAVDDSGNVLWKSDIPGHAPLGTSSLELKGALGDDDVAVTYERDHLQTIELAVFDRATGARRFEIVVPQHRGNVLDAIAITNAGVAVSMWGRLQVFEVATGKRSWEIGN